MIAIGDKAPAIVLPDKDGNEITLDDYKDKWVVVYFYPKDNTPGCTKEACEFTAALPDFSGLNTVILGISPDSQKSHQKFTDKHSLNIILLSDPDHKVLESYGAWQLKKLYGREYMGVVRSTFLINPEGTIAAVWEKVKVKGHVETVKEKLVELSH